GRDKRKTADELRDQTIFQQIFRLDVREDLAAATIFGRKHLSSETDRRRTAARGDYLFQSRESAAADEEDVGSVDPKELLPRMLAAALWRNRGHRAFHDFQECLLHTLA